MRLRQLVFRYVAFAVIATLANLGVQRALLTMGANWYVPALLSGTLVGLVVKFRLDQRWIFYDVSRKMGDETRKFWRYTLTGVVTTAIFWGTETLFWMLGETQAMREIGALIGLSIGYTLKYRLDRRFVFHVTGQKARNTSV